MHKIGPHFRSSQNKNHEENEKSSSISAQVNLSSTGCLRCQDLDNQLSQKENYIQHLRSYQKLLNAQLKVDSAESDLLVENRQLKRKITEHHIIETKLRSNIEELNKELNLKEQKLHEEGVMGQKLSQHNLDLKRSLLNLEQDKLRFELQTKFGTSPQAERPSTQLQKQQEMLDTIQNDYKKLQDRFTQLENQYGDLRESNKRDQKFIQSLIQLVKSCHPNEYFSGEPTLKNIWNWLKGILEDYMLLKSK